MVIATARCKLVCLFISGAMLGGCAAVPKRTTPEPTQRAVVVAAIESCDVERALDVDSWTISDNLRVIVATTHHYRAKWRHSRKTHDYRPDCQGWISDTFMPGGNGAAWVHWNVRTGEAVTGPLAGRKYNERTALAAARWARSTVFPGIDFSKLRINQARTTIAR